jgi:vacuolar-type H+-ATPase subunit F/Vma7
MKALYVIGDPHTVLAFALGGIPGDAVHSAAEARAALDAVADRQREAGGPQRAPILVLVTHTVSAWIRAAIDAMIIDARAPLVLEIPGFGEPPNALHADRFVERILGGQQ